VGGVLAARYTGDDEAELVRFTPLRAALPTFRLRDQDGRWATPADARGDVLALTFIYSTCRGSCPRQSSYLMEAARRAGDGVQIYGISVDPAGDTPARARRFLERNGLEDGPMRFLLGSRRELAPVWAAFGIVPLAAKPAEAAAAAAAYRPVKYKPPPPGAPDPLDRPPPKAAADPYPAADDLRYRGPPRHIKGLEFEHSAYVLLIDKHGRQRVGFPFEQLDPAALEEDMRILLREP
jgi:cytochrome oxidase Cu insertion factor (SCO1/SenC/PrrC family)